MFFSCCYSPGVRTDQCEVWSVNKKLLPRSTLLSICRTVCMSLTHHTHAYVTLPLFLSLPASLSFFLSVCSLQYIYYNINMVIVIVQ